MKSAFEIAERLLIDLPGYAVKVGHWHFIHDDTGITLITPGAYCRAIGAV